MLDYFLMLLRGLPWTLLVTGVSLLVGVVLGFPIMLARNSRVAVVRIATITLIGMVRAIPPIVWLFIIFFGIGSGAISMSPLTAAFVSFGLIAAINMAEIYRGGLISIHHGQWEAAKALNFGAAYTFIDLIWPQMIRVVLPPSATYAIGLLKDSAIASTIGVPDLAYQASRLSQLTSKGLEIFGLVGLIYILISLPIAWISRKTDHYLRAMVAR